MGQQCSFHLPSTPIQWLTPAQHRQSTQPATQLLSQPTPFWEVHRQWSPTSQKCTSPMAAGTYRWSIHPKWNDHKLPICSCMHAGHVAILAQFENMYIHYTHINALFICLLLLYIHHTFLYYTYMDIGTFLGNSPFNHPYVLYKVYACNEMLCMQCAQ